MKSQFDDWANIRIMELEKKNDNLKKSDQVFKETRNWDNMYGDDMYIHSQSERFKLWCLIK